MGNVKQKREASGNCFYTALMMMGRIENVDQWVCCHGLATGRSGEAQGLRYPHAWLLNRTTGMVFCPNLYERGVNAYIPAVAYYHLGQLETMHEYTLKQLNAKVNHTKHAGPWDKKLRKAGRKLGIRGFK